VRDTPNSRRVAVINQAFTRRYFPDEDSLGRCCGFSSRDRSAPYEIIGIVDDARYAEPRAPVSPMFFLPYLQMTASEWPDSARSRSNYIQDIALRVDASAKDLDLKVRRALADVDSNLAVVRVATLAEAVA